MRSDVLKVKVRDHNGNHLAETLVMVDGYRVLQPIDWFITDDRSMLVLTLSIKEAESDG